MISRGSDLIPLTRKAIWPAKYSACRTFKDYKTGRQILTADVYEERPVDSHGGPWGWATVQALPRSLVLEQTEIGPRIRAEPVEEINTLRVEGTRTHSSGMVVQPAKTTPLAAAGQSLDIVVRFKLPAVGSQQKWRCGVRVLASTFQGPHVDSIAGSEDTYVEIGLTNEATLPSPPAPKLSRFMPNTDFGGGDNGGSCTGGHRPFFRLQSCLKKIMRLYESEEAFANSQEQLHFAGGMPGVVRRKRRVSGVDVGAASGGGG